MDTLLSIRLTIVISAILQFLGVVVDSAGRRKLEMSSNYFAVVNASGVNQDNLVPYFGRNAVVLPTDKVYQTAVELFLDVSTSIAKIAPSKNNQLWTNLSEELGKFSSGFLDPEVPIKRYQLDLLVESIIPYLQDIKNQIQIQPARFSQIQHLLRILSGSDSSVVSSGVGEGGSHPCHSLIKIQTVILAINREGGLWKSKLSKALEEGVRKQWAPIVADHQQALLSIGGKLCILGLVEAVGRPIIMLYPLFLITKEILKISSEVEAKKRVSMQSVMQIGKMIVMLFGVVQLLGILSMYTGLGYTCLALGCVAVLVGSSDDLTKASVPVLAPHMVSISIFLEQLYHFEGVAVSALSRLNGTMKAETAPSRVVDVPAPSSSRVTELPAVDEVFSPLHVAASSASRTTAAESDQGVASPDSAPFHVSDDKKALKREAERLVQVVEPTREQGQAQVEHEEGDYVFAELDMYSSLTERDARGKEEDHHEGVRQRRKA